MATSFVSSPATPAMQRESEWVAAAVVPRDQGSHIVPRKGLQLSPRLSFERWLDIGCQLSSLTTSMAWCLGDWLVYGQAAFTDRYREAIERTSLEYQTLRNYAWVARRFALARRRDSLSFGHHAEVAALSEPEQDYWLRKAEELSWSTNHLRTEIRKSIRERTAADSSLPELSAEARAAENDPEAAASSTPAPCLGLTLNVRISAEQMKICQMAAVEYGLSLEEWILHALEDAAR